MYSRIGQRSGGLQRVTPVDYGTKVRDQVFSARSGSPPTFEPCPDPVTDAQCVWQFAHRSVWGPGGRMPEELRQAVYTTKMIEGLHRQIRKAIKTRGHFPDEQAATKLIYLAILRAHTAWKTPYRWTSALRALKIHFGDRLPD
jgi:Transposase, Mutator family